MDSPPSPQDDDVKRETPADAGSCQTGHLRAGVAVAIATIIFFTGLILSLLFFFVGTAAPEVDQTSTPSGKKPVEPLQQCGNERRDLDLMRHNVTRDSRCSLCPDRWIWWRGHCYYFSVGLEENRKWNESAEFCERHNSSLAVIKDSEEMEFMQGVMLTFPKFPFLWVGLTDSKQEGEWLWWDGTDIQHYMLVAVEWDADHRDCADLRGGGSLFAADCEAYGPWTCKRET